MSLRSKCFISFQTWRNNFVWTNNSVFSGASSARKKKNIHVFISSLYSSNWNWKIIPEFKKLEANCVDFASFLLFLLLGRQSKKAFIHWHVFVNELWLHWLTILGCWPCRLFGLPRLLNPTTTPKHIIQPVLKDSKVAPGLRWFVGLPMQQGWRVLCFDVFTKMLQSLLGYFIKD